MSLVLLRVCLGLAVAVAAAGCFGTSVPRDPDWSTRYAGSNPVALINATSVPICFVYLWPADQSSVGQDWLGPNEAVSPGVRRDFTLEPGTWGFRAVSCDGAVLLHQPGVDLGGPRELFVTDGSVPVFAPMDGFQRLEFRLGAAAAQGR
ncbi:MAG: hypothetical protein JXB32_01510 [Deltaproteobacteria bacterium]|nr:hypothetical protein [Deltaproteobacteria bacterium]